MFDEIPASEGRDQEIEITRVRVRRASPWFAISLVLVCAIAVLVACAIGWIHE